MKRRTAVALGIGGTAVVIAAAVITLAAMLGRETTLSFGARDAVSGKWVWDLTATLQGREIRSFFQSDAGPITFRFSGLAPGKSVLHLAAPGYETRDVPLTLRRGENRLPGPIDLRGTGIPGLDHFILFEHMEGTDLVCQLRPVGTDGKAVLNHPCIDLWIGASVHVQLKGGVPVREEAETGSTRGEQLFRGRLAWQWDPAPETVFRYTARTPGGAIKSDPSLYRVVDYLVVVPDPLKITRDEMGALMERAWAAPDQAGAARILDGEKGRVRYFSDTSWNVKGVQE